MISTTESKDVEVEGLDSAAGRSSWHDSHSCWMGSLWLVGNEELAKRKIQDLSSFRWSYLSKQTSGGDVEIQGRFHA
jgi:hypothetical protein